jgi:hypothetical protein
MLQTATIDEMKWRIAGGAWGSGDELPKIWPKGGLFMEVYTTNLIYLLT